jgi:hypothetical protein
METKGSTVKKLARHYPLSLVPLAPGDALWFHAAPQFHPW